MGKEPAQRGWLGMEGFFCSALAEVQAWCSSPVPLGLLVAWIVSSEGTLALYSCNTDVKLP